MQKVRLPEGFPATPPGAVPGERKLPVSALDAELVLESEMVLLRLVHMWEREEDARSYLLTIPAAKLLERMLHDAVEQYVAVSLGSDQPRPAKHHRISPPDTEEAP